MSGGASYLRCKHCKGFYETSSARCKWCDYDDPLLDDAGRPRLFPDRETCRSIQISEYDRLPPEAHADSMGPPKDELALLCNCLHCGPDGHRFEAVEMRWMATERMWACPCTTCGGRGFGIDIHSAENKWQCAECGHFYLPANGDYRHENAKCPKCGSTYANGWFDDGSDDEDEYADDAAADDDLPPFNPLPGEPHLDDSLPWDDEDEDDDLSDVFGVRPSKYDLGITWKESDADDDFGDPDDPFADPDGRLPDDIDFPHHRDDRETGFNDDDIPF